LFFTTKDTKFFHKGHKDESNDSPLFVANFTEYAVHFTECDGFYENHASLTFKIDALDLNIDVLDMNVDVSR